MKILDYIFCDDIRFEVSGKYSLIGLYQDSINIETKNPATIQWPIGLRVGVFVRLRLEGGIAAQQEADFHFEIKFNGEQIGATQGSLTINEEASVIVALPMGPYHVAVPGPGDFTFTLRLSQSGRELAVLESPYALPVRVRQVAAVP